MGGLTVKVVALERNHKITRHFITAPGLLVENHLADRHFADTQILKVGLSTNQTYAVDQTASANCLSANCLSAK
jgi:hypothetical protein